MKRFVLTVIIFLLFAAPASAANFVELGRNDDNVVSIDLDSIQDKGTYCLAWVKFIPRGGYAKELRKFYKNDVNYSLVLYALDKREKKSQLLQSATYLKNGQVKSDSYHFNQYNYEYVIPGSIGELVYDTVMYVMNNRE